MTGTQGLVEGVFTFPCADSLVTLSETAQTILAAARRLLAAEGYAGLSYEKVAMAAGVDKGTIRYNFGKKENLVAAVVDSYIHDECLRMAAELKELEGSARTQKALQGFRQIVLAGNAWDGWWDIVPHALRDEALKSRVRGLYAWWYHMNLAWVGSDSSNDVHLTGPASGLAAIMAALVDGLSLQVRLGLEFDFDAAMDLLERLIESTLAEEQRVAATSRS